MRLSSILSLHNIARPPLLCLPSPSQSKQTKLRKTNFLIIDFPSFPFNFISKRKIKLECSVQTMLFKAFSAQGLPNPRQFHIRPIIVIRGVAYQPLLLEESSQTPLIQHHFSIFSPPLTHSLSPLLFVFPFQPPHFPPSLYPQYSLPRYLFRNSSKLPFHILILSPQLGSKDVSALLMIDRCKHKIPSLPHSPHVSPSSPDSL